VFTDLLAYLNVFLAVITLQDGDVRLRNLRNYATIKVVTLKALFSATIYLLLKSPLSATVAEFGDSRTQSVDFLRKNLYKRPLKFVARTPQVRLQQHILSVR